MEPKDLSHLAVFSKGTFPSKVVEVASVEFKGGRVCELHVIGIQRDRREQEFNLVHAASYGADSIVTEVAHLRYAMLEDVTKYTLMRKP